MYPWPIWPHSRVMPGTSWNILEHWHHKSQLIGLWHHILCSFDTWKLCWCDREISAKLLFLSQINWVLVSGRAMQDRNNCVFKYCFSADFPFRRCTKKNETQKKNKTIQIPTACPLDLYQLEFWALSHYQNGLI